MAAESQQGLPKRKMKSALLVGFVGGMFWSIIGYALYFMNFTKLGPSIFAKPFFSSQVLDKPWAHFIGIGIITFLSIGIALLYVFTLSQFYTPWLGLGLGAGLFAVFFYVVSPMLRLLDKPIHQIGMNTFSTELCLFLLYGLFIGLTLATEYSSSEGKAK